MARPTYPNTSQAAFGLAGNERPLAAARYERTAGDYTTNSTSFVDVDSTNMALRLITGARRVLVGLTANGYNNSGSGYLAIDLLMDGVSVSGATHGILLQNRTTYTNVSFTWMTDVLLAGSHTFKLQFKAITAGQSRLIANTSEGKLLFYAQEMPT